jgi:glycosyltransferase involved in cell wall biosynthesis
MANGLRSPARMKVLHIIPSLSLKSGGPSVALSLIARCLVNLGGQVDVATTDDDGSGCRMNVPLGRRLERDGYGVFYFRKQTEFYKVSLPFAHWLRRHMADYDVVHIHALFSFTSVSAARCARRRGVPYIIRPLGVLNRWGMENRRKFLKSLSFRFVEKSILRHAAAMHYTSCAEQIEAEQVDATAPAVVIPLGIDVSEFQNLPGPELFLSKFPNARNKKLVLFLSRLNAKKGLDLLLPAFAEIKRRNPQTLLVVAGNGEASYERSLRAQATGLGLNGDIVWTGFLDGLDKLSAMNAATLFVLPSYSENFGIALVEALAAGLPCVVTEGVAASELVREHEAGIVIRAEVSALASALDRLLDNAKLRARLGSNARRFAAERFSIEVMGVALMGLYEQIISEQKAVA